jgi:hypothetical protein
MEKDLFTDIEDQDETVKEICDNEDRFNSRKYFKECELAEQRKISDKKDKNNMKKSLTNIRKGINL